MNLLHHSYSTIGVRPLLCAAAFIVVSFVLSGCSPSTSDIEELVDRELETNERSYELWCPACQGVCRRYEYEVKDISQDSESKDWFAFIKFYYSCETCEKLKKESDWSKTWCFSLRDSRESFWDSLRHDWILPIRRHPKCLLFKLFSGDFFCRYDFGYYYGDRSRIEKCESRANRIFSRVKVWLWIVGVIIFLIVEAIKNWAKVKFRVMPILHRAIKFVCSVLAVLWDISAALLREWWTVLRWVIGSLLVLQLLVKFWQYWNN